MRREVSEKMIDNVTATSGESAPPPSFKETIMSPHDYFPPDLVRLESSDRHTAKKRRSARSSHDETACVGNTPAQHNSKKRKMRSCQKPSGESDKLDAISKEISNNGVVPHDNDL